MKNIMLCLLNVAFVATGQLLFKAGAKGQTFDSVTSVIKAMFSPLILLGGLFYVSTLVLWIYILSVMPISRANPISALAYPIILIAAKLLFNEAITPLRWIGIAIIFIGVILVAQ